MKTLLLILCVMLPIAAQAERQHGLSLFTEYLTIDSGTADKEGVDDEAFSIGGSYSLIPHPHFFFRLDVGVTVFEDEDEFQQLVVEERLFDDDRLVLEESDVTGVFANLSAGARTQTEGPVDAFILAGVRFMDVERDIIQCEDCREEDVDVDGGAFIQPGVNYGFNAFQVALAYSIFLDGDLEGALGLSIDFIFD